MGQRVASARWSGGYHHELVPRTDASLVQGACWWLATAATEYEMPGMPDVQCFGGGLYVANTSSLHPGWQGLLSKALSSTMPYLEKGAIRGVSLGEMSHAVGDCQ